MRLNRDWSIERRVITDWKAVAAMFSKAEVDEEEVVVVVAIVRGRSSRYELCFDLLSDAWGPSRSGN